jgi:membrane-anchored protein YejM (alkaline phosphatase superfamily)
MSRGLKHKYLYVGLAGFILVLLAAGCARETKDFNVVLVSLDTTRGDYVDTGRGARAFTPELKRFSRKAVVFERAYCTIPQTLPSHLSMLTSYFPGECGVYSNQHQYDGRHKRLPETLKQNGYATAGVVSLGTLSSDTGIAGGFDRYLEGLNDEQVFYTTAERVTREAERLLDEIGKQKFFLFLHYSDPHSPYAPPNVRGRFTISVDGKTEAAFNAHQGAILRKTIVLAPGTHLLRFKLESHVEDFDAFVIRHLKFSKNCRYTFKNIEFSRKHYNGSHVMKGNEGVIRVTASGEGEVKIFQVIPLVNWKAAMNYYRLEVEYMDRYVGKFLRKLETMGLMKRTVVVIVGDHGEGLGEREHYFGHVRYLNRQFIEVPFMIYLPGTAPRRIGRPASLVSISPTLLEFLGIRDDSFQYQRSLLTVIRSGKNDVPGDDGAAPVYSFAFSPSAVEDKVSVIRWPYQYILNRDKSGEISSELYHLKLSQSSRKWDQFSPAVMKRSSNKTFLFFQQEHRRLVNSFTGNLARANMDRDRVEKLRTMGYVH